MPGRRAAPTEQARDACVAREHKRLGMVSDRLMAGPARGPSPEASVSQSRVTSADLAPVSSRPQDANNLGARLCLEETSCAPQKTARLNNLGQPGTSRRHPQPT